jgi:hypothetical protein
VYFNFAVRMTEHSMLFLHTITFLFGYIRIVNALIDSWSVCGDIMTRAISHGRRVITRCKETIHRLHYFWRYCRCCGEIALLYAEDLTYFVRRPHTFQPEMNRTMDEISRRDCYTWFGIMPNDLRRLYDHWRIPDRLQAPRSRHWFQGEACFIICLFHMVKGTTFIDMSQRYFGGDPRYMSLMHEAMIDHLYDTFYHKKRCLPRVTATEGGI